MDSDSNVTANGARLALLNEALAKLPGYTPGRSASGMTVAGLVDPSEEGRARRDEFARRQREADERHKAVLEFRRTIAVTRQRRIQANRDRVHTARAMTLVARSLRVRSPRVRHSAQPREHRRAARCGAHGPPSRRSADDPEPVAARRP